jgi:Bacterial regulatory proteins, luxR family
MQPGEDHATQLTKRQREVLERLELGYGAKQIATDIGISRNAVYQTIERLRRYGTLPETYTPSGQPPRRASTAGAVAFGPAAVPPRGSVLAELRALATGGESDEPSGYAELIEGAVASGDVAALAYELGRLDARAETGLASDLVASALRRLGALREGRPLVDNRPQQPEGEVRGE